jgi:hypothetical protein
MTDTPPATTPGNTGGAAKPRAPLRTFLPAIGVLVVFALYTLYWFVAATQLRREVETFAARADPEEVIVSWRSLGVSGFPYRIALGFDNPQARAPDAPENWHWQAQGLEADFLPYNLRHVVLKVDGEQQLRYSDVRGANSMRHLLRARAVGTWASYVDVKGAPFGRLAIDIDHLVAARDGSESEDLLTGISGERMSAARLQLHLRPSEEADGAPPQPVDALTRSYDLALQGDDMVLAASAPAAVLGTEVKLIAVQARLRDVPRKARTSLVELSRDWLQQGGSLDVSDLRIQWGPLDLWAQGRVTLDADARPMGRFDAEVTDYAKLLAALVKAGIVRQQDAKLTLLGLGLVSQLQGKAEGRISVPIVMKDGKLFLGPLVVAHLDPVY